jgi:hypothetical protein
LPLDDVVTSGAAFDAFGGRVVAFGVAVGEAVASMIDAAADGSTVAAGAGSDSEDG